MLIRVDSRQCFFKNSISSLNSWETKTAGSIIDRPTVSTDSDRYWHTETVRHLKRKNNIVINVKSEPCSLYIQLLYVDAHPSICDQLIKNNEPR